MRADKFEEEAPKKYATRCQTIKIPDRDFELAAKYGVLERTDQ